MIYDYTDKARKQIHKLPNDALKKLQRLRAEIIQARSIYDIQRTETVKGYKGLYRIKRPPYRVIVELDGNTLIIKSIVKRDEGTYKKL